LRSEANARAFADDQIIDALDIFSAFKKWLVVGDPNATTPILDATLAAMEQAKTQLGVTRNKYVRTEDIAKALHRIEEYKHFNKVSSKLIHPTAYSPTGRSTFPRTFRSPFETWTCLSHSCR
jgi:hypothetical protein